jgi:hypothetical protein
VSNNSTNNWKLNPEIFKQVNKILGPLDTDLFAERLNAQTNKFISWKPDQLAVGTDAFTVNWLGLNAYAFPPFCLIPKVLEKIRKELSEIVLIAPAWHTQAFYPMLLEMTIEHPVLLPPQRDLLLSPQGHYHPLVLNKSLRLVAWKISRRPDKCKAFLRKLPSYGSLHGEQVRSQLTTAAGENGLAGVVCDKLINFNPLWKI